MNCLIVPQIRADLTDDSRVLLTLPATLAALMRDEVVSFPALRAHQRHAWHSFIALLAANSLLRARRTEPPTSEIQWRDLLRSLTPDDADDAPWCLVSPPERPALLQPPVSGGSLGKLKKLIPTPDRLDILVTAKNHDFKQAMMVTAQPDDWLFALLTLQSMEGTMGAGNYGISRMNGGFANRAALGIAPPGGIGAHVRRDVMRLLASRERYAECGGYAAEGGLTLVWLSTWDGVRSLRRHELDPWYIEVCRRVRLGLCDGRLIAYSGPSQAARIAPIVGGVTGDPWSPVVTEKGGRLKSLTVDARGFGYRRMVDLIFRRGGMQPAPLQTPETTDAAEGLQLVARALVRGQGKTEGYHERRVPISRRCRRMFSEQATDEVAGIAIERVHLAGEMQDHVLKPALFELFQNGPDNIDFSNRVSQRKAAAFLKRFDYSVDARFFEDLWQEIELDNWEAQANARAAWVKRLLESARSLLLDAETSVARSARRRFRASARAADRLYRAAYHSKRLKPYLTVARCNDAG